MLLPSPGGQRLYAVDVIVVEFGGAIGWLVVVVAAILAGFAVVVAVRKWARREVRAEAFTVQDLRDMRARWQITEAEFVAMRATLLQELGLPIPPSAQPPAPPPGGAGGS